MFLETSPRQLLDRFLGTKFILEKQIYSQGDMGNLCGRLPLSVENTGLRMAGAGDYNFSRSTGGSVVIDGFVGGVVAKVMVGECKICLNEIQSSRGQMIKFFDNLAPPTIQVVSEIDGKVQSIIIQKKIQGKPVCEASFRELLRLNALRSMRKIYRMEMELYRMTGIFDNSGIKTKIVPLKWLFLQMIPVLSDNIMIDGGGRVWLNDNVPPVGLTNGVVGGMKYEVKLAILKTVDKIMGGLIWMRGGYAQIRKTMGGVDTEKYSQELAFEV